MRILKIAGIVLLVLIGLPLIAALFMKKQYHVERSVVITAPQGRVFTEVSNMRNINSWSPFLEKYPDSQVTYAGEDGAVGSSSSWSGQKAGEGTQTITAITPDQIKVRLDFKKPFENTAFAAYDLKPEGSGTKVTWSMDGENPYPMNLMIPMMDGMIGESYQRGLERLKGKIETGTIPTDPSRAEK